MNSKFDYDLDDDDPLPRERFQRMRRDPNRRTRNKLPDPITGQMRANPKASYEANEQVQRWLKREALEDRAKPPFRPTFLASLRDGPWILSSLEHFYEENLINDVLHVVKSGKEASVYCCAADPTTGQEHLAAKVYRPRMFRSLKNDVVYRQGRETRDEEGHVVRDPRRQRGAMKKSMSWHLEKVSSWIEYEFQTQRLLYEAGANVPKAVSQVGNAILMEYIGDVDAAAPLLREVTLSREEAQPLFDTILRNIGLCLANHRIHGDLSEYNILYWQGAVTLIDFAQAVDPHYNDSVFPLLARDIERVCRYFARYGVRAQPQRLAADLWTRYQMGDL